MIKEALEYIIGLRKEDVIEINDRKYSTFGLVPVKEPQPAALKVSNLTSLIDYIDSNVDNLSTPLILHVSSPTEVEVKSAIFGPFEQRTNFLEAAAQTPDFRFGNWYDQESFIIALQSKFQMSEHMALVMQLVGGLTDGTVRTFGDDGTTQTVQAKAGLAKVADISVPNPVLLIPFRTFTEVEQPASRFVFRMKSGRELPEMALFEADGGAWKNVAMRNVRDYLGKELASFLTDKKIVLIS